MPWEGLCMNCMSGRLERGVCQKCGAPDSEPDRPESALPRRSVTGDYLIGRVLGQGGFGITYLAWDLKARRRVALKELFPLNMVVREEGSSQIRVLSEHQQFFDHIMMRFWQEAKNIYYLRNYPEVIRIYDLFMANGTSYYSMQFLEGKDMSRLVVNHQGVSWKRIEKPIRDCIRTLKIVHGHGLIHRDITPENILLQNRGRAMLIDFGSMRSENAECFTVLVKREYAPIEQFFTNERQGSWTDTFSLCASIYFLLSGCFPVDAMERQMRISYGHPDPLPALQTLPTDAPEHVLRAVMKGMSLYAPDRWQNADELERALFPEPVRKVMSVRLRCVSGRLQGKEYLLQYNNVIRLGRGKEGNNIALPSNTRGVSRKQCAFYVDSNGQAFVQDQQSNYGTCLEQTWLEPLVWYRVRKGQRIVVGAEVFQLC